MTGLLFFRKHPLVQINQQGLLIVCISTIVVPLVVAALKATTNIPCPNDISHYGGIYPYVTLLKAYPQSFHQVETIMCYPAGHASGGFAFLSLFFLFTTTKNKIIALSLAMIVGWTMGTYKMLIGDHFLSHTIVTMMLSWLIILITAKMVRSMHNEAPVQPLLQP
jgi:membrane-associated PAP2 superfamily phosphatase